MIGKKALLLCALFFLAAPCLTGCNHYPYQGEMMAKPPAFGQPEIELFSYDKKIDEIPIILKEQRTNERWTEYQLKFKVKDFPEGKNKYAKAFFFVPKNLPDKAPCLVLLPPTGGPRDLIAQWGAKFADKGFMTMAFYRRERFFNPNKPLDYNINLFRQAVIDVRRGIDYFETRPDADTTRIGIMGISLGGIITALSTEADGRIQASVSLVSAAHMDDILDSSTYQVVRKMRHALIDRYGVSKDKIAEYVEPILRPIDPATYADRIDPARLLMINGRSDGIIKYHVAQRSRQTYGDPEMYVSLFGHYAIIGGQRFIFERVQNHFVTVLNLRKGADDRFHPIKQ